MSTQSRISQTKSKITVPQIAARKGGEPIVCLTAYSAPVAKLLDPHVDLLLVGDSVGMVVHGFESTLDVTLEHMIMHGQAVVRGAESALVVVDMPFGSYEESPELAYRNAVRVLRETGCSAVKLEGGVAMAETIRFLTERGVPVMGHVGLQPQSVRQTGGYKVVGRDRDEWADVEADARAVADAGAFSIVLEGMAAPLAAKITKRVPIPTIGIGAAAECDGQVLVVDDMLGMFDWAPKFVKQYANLREPIAAAAKAYAEEVRARTFPAENHTYKVKDKSPSLVVAS